MIAWDDVGTGSTAVVFAHGLSEDRRVWSHVVDEPARRAYLKAGFEVRDERRDPRWQEEIGAPGTELLWRPL